jgi:hypothetical protein
MGRIRMRIRIRSRDYAGANRAPYAFLPTVMHRLDASMSPSASVQPSFPAAAATATTSTTFTTPAASASEGEIDIARLDVAERGRRGARWFCTRACRGEFY